MAATATKPVPDRVVLRFVPRRDASAESSVLVRRPSGAYVWLPLAARAGREQSSLGALPTDLLHHVAAHLAPRSVCTLAAVSKALRRACAEAPVWSRLGMPLQLFGQREAARALWSLLEAHCPPSYLYSFRPPASGAFLARHCLHK